MRRHRAGLLDGSGDRNYLDQFSSYLTTNGQARPAIWGWHAYDGGRARSPRRFKNVLSRIPKRAKVWLTEQGGILYGGNFPAESAGDAASDLNHPMTLPKMFPTRIRRFYYFSIQGGVKFDSGLLDQTSNHRAAYYSHLPSGRASYTPADLQ